MRFGAPRALWVLLVLLPVVLIQLRTFIRGRRELLNLTRQWHTETVQTLYAVKWFFSSLAFVLFVAAAVFALADVSWGERPVEEDRESLDVVVSIDISRSMLATDISPSRLERSIAVVRSVSRQLPQARFGIVAFKGDAVTLLPLTEDANALEAVLDGISTRLVSAPGTDIERGLETALDAFPPGTNAHRAVILLSDGEGLSGSPGRVAAEARRVGTPVFTIIAGTAEGSTIPLADGSVVTDQDGRPVVSRASPALLTEISETTGAHAISLTDTEIVSALTESLEGHVEGREQTGFRLVPVRRYPFFVGLALVALVISMTVRTIRWNGLF
jgi:Ca-activated chloride channel family protein